MFQDCQLVVEDVFLWTDTNLVMQVSPIKRQVHLLENHAPTRRFNETNDHLDSCSFSSTIVAKESEYFPFVHLNAKTINGLDITVVLRQVLDL